MNVDPMPLLALIAELYSTVSRLSAENAQLRAVAGDVNPSENGHVPEPEMAR